MCWSSVAVDLLPDTQNYALHMRRECRKRFPRHRLQWKPLVSDPGMHDARDARAVIHGLSWGMSGSLTGSGGETFPEFPAHAQPAILPIW